MTRKTETASKTSQYFLDTFWGLIEDHYEEEWRVQADGSMILTVDSDMFERVIQDNYAQMLPRPENLIGEYIIKGVYDANQRLVDGDRTYFFIQGA